MTVEVVEGRICVRIPKSMDDDTSYDQILDI